MPTEAPFKAPGRIKGAFKGADRIKAALRAPSRIWQSLKPPDTTWQASFNAPDRIKAALRAPALIKAALRAPNRIWQALKAPGNTWQASFRPPHRIKATLRAPDRIKAALKPPDRIKAALRAPEKTWKPRPIPWRPAGVAAATTQPEGRPPWSPDPEPTPSSGARRYRPGLDGLRALAVVGVLLYHAGVHWVPGGFLGVDLFFVISGYLITSLLIAEVERTGGISFASFFRRRARRLLPALGLLLVVTTAALVAFWPDELAKVRGDIVASLGYVTNWWFIVHHQSYFQATGRPSPLQHLWSLAVEEQFYLVWPATVGLLLAGSVATRRLKLVAAAAFGGAVASTAWMAVIAVSHNVPYVTDASRVYFGTDTHAMGVLVGSGAAVVATWAERQGWMQRFGDALDIAGVVGLAGVCWAMTHTSEFVPALYRGGFLLFAALAALPVVAAGRERSWLGEGLGSAPLRWVGLRSYSLYLWHWPIYVFTRPQLDVPFTKGGDLLLRLALTFAAAEASYRWVEEPIRAKGLRAWAEGIAAALNFPRNWRTATALYAACVLIVVGAAGFMLSATHTPQPPPVSPVAVSPVAAHGAAAPTPAAASAPGTGALPTESMTAIGDSVMLGALPDLQQAFPGAMVDAVEGRQAAEVFALVDSLLANGRLGRIVVLQTGTNGTIDPAVLDTVLGKLAGRKVVILNVHVPRPWQNPDNTLLAQAVRSNGKVSLVDWNAAASAHPQWLWDDGVHLRTAGAQQYTDLIAAALR
ncbi:MAG TPA: acyltransferase family protein [Actinomycetota bacterium]|nr:acyltransferase family protein [Actinomycetota bacterium]